MALFGKTNAFLGIDIGSSHVKIVELVDRRRRIEVATYARAALPNLLVRPTEDENAAITRTANVISQMLDQANVATDAVIAALPSSIVFSTLINLPLLPDEEIDKAVHFEARDIVPANLDDMVVGWSRVGEVPHLDTDKQIAAQPSASNQPAAASKQPLPKTENGSLPIFVTAAPKDVVNRYIKLVELLKLQLVAIEVETFSLIRSLFDNPQEASGLIVDIGDRTTTFDVIDHGTPRVAHSIEYGGHDITVHLAKTLGIPEEEAEAQKIKFGLSNQAPENVHDAVEAACGEILQQGQQVLNLYETQHGHPIKKTILIGGSGRLKNLSNVWTNVAGHQAVVGDPWRGYAYPQELETTMRQVGPVFAVAVGLAGRGFSNVQ